MIGLHPAALTYAAIVTFWACSGAILFFSSCHELVGLLFSVSLHPLSFTLNIIIVDENIVSFHHISQSIANIFNIAYTLYFSASTEFIICVVLHGRATIRHFF